MNIDEYKSKIESIDTKSIVDNLESGNLIKSSGNQKLKELFSSVEDKQKKLSALIDAFKQIVSIDKEIQGYKDEINKLNISINNLDKSEEVEEFKKINRNIKELENKINDLNDKIKTIASNC